MYISTEPTRGRLFSGALQAVGRSPLRRWPTRRHILPRWTVGRAELTIADFGQNPALLLQPISEFARLRRVLPEPVASREIADGDWVAIVTPVGRVRARARLVASLADGVVGAQHGWWPGSTELGLLGYDPLSANGANVILVIGNEGIDPVSNVAAYRSYHCKI